MKKLIPIAVILSFAVCSGCSSDDPAPTEPPPPPPPVRVVANTTVSAPTLSSVDEAVWDNVTEFVLDISTQNSPKLPAPASSAVSDSVNVKAIVSGGELFLRVEFDDDDLNILREFHQTVDIDLNFSRITVSHEDQVFVMFSGLPNGDLDVWNWRSLTTGTAGLAEGFTFVLSNDTLVVDAGAQQVAFSNAHPIDSTRPVWVDTTSPNYTGDFIYIENRDSIQKYLTFFREPGIVVPGYYIDTNVRSNVQITPQSRWDIFTVSAFDAVNEKITVVLKRILNTGWPEDFVMVDSVEFRIGLFDDQDRFDLGGSRRGYTDLFWLIL